MSKSSNQAKARKPAKRGTRKLTVRLLLVSALALHSQFGRHLDVVFKQDALVECAWWW